ncbi:hypothetical protein AVEN_73725-1, partial [Araneus ventricosus]
MDLSPGPGARCPVIKKKKPYRTLEMNSVEKKKEGRPAFPYDLLLYSHSYPCGS